MISCSSTPERDVDIDVIFDKIENADFKPEKEVPFREKQDSFVGKESGYDSLSRESIARFPDPKLEYMGDLHDPISKGVSFCYRKQFLKGFKILYGAFPKYKKHPSFWNQIGTCYYLQGRYRMSLLYYNKAREINSRYAPPINNLGVLYQAKGKDQKAIMAFQKAAKLSPFSMTPVFNLAQIYLRYGFVNKAYKYFSILRDRHQYDIDVLNGLATCNLFMGKHGEAIRLYEDLDDEVLYRPYISLNYAVALKLEGRTDNARKVFSVIDRSRLLGLKSYYKKVARFIGSN